jgi:hypothetical protein
MFPFSFEWIWDAGHIVFHGGLWYALNIIGIGMTYCVIKAVIDRPKARGPRPPLKAASFARKTVSLKRFSPYL